MTSLISPHFLVISIVWTFIALGTEYECASTAESNCVRARTDAGWVCGVQKTYNNKTFASFLGVPYARQPVGNLRFKELQPAEPWEGCFDATTLGPICPQYDVLYGSLMTNKNSSEACIHANIYVPIHALPRNDSKSCQSKNTSLPILVFIHGGGYAVGSGDPDISGPEYLMSENVIVITFNYRLNVFGFFTLGTAIPPNNGLRDMRTLLKWVQLNAANIGGNPNDVTLMGQSAGAVSVHLLSMSNATKGLFNRVIMLSGASIRSFYTATPIFANTTSQLLLTYLGINSTDHEEIHQQLVAMPLDTLMNATYKIQAEYGISYFTPVIEEEKYENFTTIVDVDPEIMLRNGRGKDIPALISFTNVEGSSFIPFYTENNILDVVESNPLAIIPPDLSYKMPSERALEIANQSIIRCFNGTPTVEKYVKCFGDFTLVYPALKVAQIRASMNDSAPVYLYQFSYNSSCSPIKETKNISYDGSAHLDDLAFYFRTNSMKNISCFQNPSDSEIAMRRQAVSYIKNFISCNDPLCSSCTSDSTSWPAETSEAVQYENIVDPNNIYYTDITEDQADLIQFLDPFYDELYETTS